MLLHGIMLRTANGCPLTLWLGDVHWHSDLVISAHNSWLCIGYYVNFKHNVDKYIKNNVDKLYIKNLARNFSTDFQRLSGTCRFKEGMWGVNMRNTKYATQSLILWRPIESFFFSFASFYDRYRLTMHMVSRDG